MYLCSLALKKSKVGVLFARVWISVSSSISRGWKGKRENKGSFEGDN